MINTYRKRMRGRREGVGRGQRVKQLRLHTIQLCSLKLSSYSPTALPSLHSSFVSIFSIKQRERKKIDRVRVKGLGMRQETETDSNLTRR